MKIDFSFSREERLKNFTAIRSLFTSGRALNHYPFRIIWLPLEGVQSVFPVQVAISVPRKKFPRAVDRNRIKRLIREAYRLHKHELYQALAGETQCYAIMIMYVDKSLPVYAAVEPQISKALHRLGKKIVAASAPNDSDGKV
ncbi:MAG: ribonuclease P protein component [Saprospiraceae bacterium]|nr:ribonuclease P protein component [Saprospiraceae bacterium]MDP4819497.1 ribonuclease P protein component [Saprospiraceae bacterium]